MWRSGSGPGRNRPLASRMAPVLLAKSATRCAFDRGRPARCQEFDTWGRPGWFSRKFGFGGRCGRGAVRTGLVRGLGHAAHCGEHLDVLAVAVARVPRAVALDVPLGAQADIVDLLAPGLLLEAVGFGGD